MFKLDKVSGSFFYDDVELSYSTNLNKILKNVNKRNNSKHIDLLDPDNNVYMIRDPYFVTMKLYFNDVDFLIRFTLTLHAYNRWAPDEEEKMEVLQKLQSILNTFGCENTYTWGSAKIIYDDWNKYYLLEIAYSDAVIIKEKFQEKEKSVLNKILNIFK